MDKYRSSQCVIPVVLIVDAAKSTKGKYLEMLNHNMNRIIRTIGNTKNADAVRLLMLGYNEQNMVKSHFASLRDIRPGGLALADGEGIACTGDAVTFALDSLEEQYQVWNGSNIAHTKPVCLLLTDDRPVDWPEDRGSELEFSYLQAAQRVQRMEREGSLAMAGCAMSQIRRIRCNQKLLQQMCQRIFDVRQMPDGVENMEEGFSAVISWMQAAMDEAWAGGPKEAGPFHHVKHDTKPVNGAVKEAVPVPDDPVLRFLGIVDEGV